MSWSKRPLIPAAIIYSCEMQNSVKDRFSSPTPTLTKAEREQEIAAGDVASVPCTFNLSQLQQRIQLSFLHFSKSAVGADELIISKS